MDKGGNDDKTKDSRASVVSHCSEMSDVTIATTEMANISNKSQGSAPSKSGKDNPVYTIEGEKNKGKGKPAEEENGYV